MASVAAGTPEHPFADRQDHAGFLGDLDELHRPDHAALRVPPPDQRLVADYLAFREVELRLVVQVEIAAQEGCMQFEFDPLPVVGDLAHVRVKHRPVADAAGAGVLQRKIGAAQQQNRIGTVLRHVDDTDRQVDRLQMRRQLVGRHHLLDKLLDDPVDRLCRLAVGIKHREFAGPDASDDRVFRQAGAQALRKGADQLVALAVADRIVDMLETVDIDVDEEYRLAAPYRCQRRLCDLADHGDADVEAG